MEVYSAMIEETFGLSVFKPPKNKSYSICDDCIENLRNAANFRQQIINCEEKFKEYLLNEEALSTNVKVEIELNNDDRNVLNKTCLLLGVPELNIKREINEGNDFDDCDYAETSEIKNEEINMNHIKKEYEAKNRIKIKIEAPLRTKLKKIANLKPKLKKSTTQDRKLTRTKNPLKDSNESKKRMKPKKPKRNCEDCGIVFEKRSELNIHNNVHHKYRGTFTCVDCHQEHEQFEQMFEHVRIHGKDSVKCRFCDKHFQNKTLHMDHENSVHTREIVHICDICNKRYFYKGTITKHLLWHAGLNKKFFCETCGHSFNDRTNLRYHIDAVHLNLRKFPCDQCNKTFKAKKVLKEHVATKHLGIEYAQYPCKECPAIFKSWRSRRHHLDTHHPNKEFPERNEVVINPNAYSYYCKVCPEVFHNRGRFKAHVLRHSKEGKLPHMCHVCGLSFSTTYTLRRHEQLHIGLKPFKCDICQKAFSHPTQVVRHKKNVHNPVKTEKIKCPICKQNVRNMDKHQKIHTTRPYMCEQCHRSYPEKNTLNRHIREFHLGIYKHNCDICNTKFRNVKILAKHRRACVREFKPADADVVNYDSALPISEYSVEVEINP
ncbi:hypothetical protein O0L34_g12268 [Tuta absoluta]|nr:hypothetical protein O0L34_g12268 [Tuta absoluta]